MATRSAAKPVARRTPRPGLPVVGISLGDPSGVGPEVTAKALADRRVRRALQPVVFGDAGAIASFRELTKLEQVRGPLKARPAEPTLVEVSRLKPEDRVPGTPTHAGGRAQFEYVKAAIRAAKKGYLDAICTAPVSKEQISRAGIPFMGHTEVLAAAWRREVLMLMDGPRVRVALATNHVPLMEIAQRLSVEKLVRQLHLLSTSLQPLVGHLPRIAVCGLNPHAGEGGLLGREEVELITPALEQALHEGLDVYGPFPADGLFAKVPRGRFGFDAVLAMYHDQGLVAAKALDFELTVNVTLGLPVPRTSPDHGTAYDIAGKNKASPEPMIAALLSAARLVSARSSPSQK